MLKPGLVLGLLLVLLSGCGDLQTPSWMAGDNGRPAGTLPPPKPLAFDYTPSPQPEPPPTAVFSITTGMGGDPRLLAMSRCGREFHRNYFVLRQTKINRTDDPENDTITWYFDCTY